jgi:dolichol kinase
VGARMEWYIEQIFKELPFGIAIAMVVFLSILLIIWLLLPLWVLFIQWNTGKIKDEIRHLVDLMEKREQNEKGKNVSEPKE